MRKPSGGSKALAIASHSASAAGSARSIPPWSRRWSTARCEPRRRPRSSERTASSSSPASGSAAVASSSSLSSPSEPPLPRPSAAAAAAASATTLAKPGSAAGAASAGRKLSRKARAPGADAAAPPARRLRTRPARAAAAGASSSAGTRLRSAAPPMRGRWRPRGVGSSPRPSRLASAAPPSASPPAGGRLYEARPARWSGSRLVSCVAGGAAAQPASSGRGACCSARRAIARRNAWDIPALGAAVRPSRCGRGVAIYGITVRCALAGREIPQYIARRQSAIVELRLATLVLASSSLLGLLRASDARIVALEERRRRQPGTRA